MLSLSPPGDSAIIGRMVSQQSPAVPAPSAGPSAGESERLAEAFRIFNQASEELATAYTQLQGQVAALTEELAARLAAAGHPSAKSLYTVTVDQLLALEGVDQDLAIRLIDAVHAHFGD